MTRQLTNEFATRNEALAYLAKHGFAKAARPGSRGRTYWSLLGADRQKLLDHSATLTVCGSTFIVSDFCYAD